MTMPTPAFNPLEDLYQLISSGKIVKDITYRGKVFKFRSLSDEDYIWCDRFADMSSPVALTSSRRAPTLAIATVAIDGIAVEQIEDLNKVDESLSPEVKAMIRENSKFLRAYNLKDVFTQLGRQYIAELYGLYLEQVEVPSRTVGPEEVKNS